MTNDQSSAMPPIAEQRAYSAKWHGKTLEDPWNWLRDKGYPKVTDKKVLSYLEAENDWFKANMGAHEALTETLFEEIKGRIKEDDSSVPQKDGDWLYWVEYEKGAQYKKWYRKPVNAPADDKSAVELLIDEVALAEGKDYFRLGTLSVSPDHNLLAYAVDDDGSEHFTARIKDLRSGELLDDIIPDTLSSLVWRADSKAFLYGLVNDQWRTDNARLHVLGTPVADDVELYHEADEGFRVDIGLTSSEKYIVIATGDHETSEIRLLPTDNPQAEPILVSARKKGREYDVEERDGTLYILTNDDHINFRLASADIAEPDKWTSLIEGSDDFYITGMTAFKNFYVIDGRKDGLDEIQIRYYDQPDRVEPVVFPEASYTADLGDNPEWDMAVLRMSYQSMITPATVYDYDVAARSLTTLKVQEIPSGYNADDYRAERVMISARDGVQIPVSIITRKDFQRDGSAPLHLYGYGAYGMAIPPGFSVGRLSMVDRGFAFAIAHIRGGDDLGRQWYLDGKLTKRTNTFNDFVDVAKALVDLGYTSKGRLTASGGSAGGELIGAIVNSDPDLWGAVVAHVPFVDVLNTMLDESLPLTPGEWPEWGNPISDKAAFDLIASYSPYDNIKRQAYPPMMVTAGLNDPRVTYWEPAKWVAKLREYKTDDNVLLLKTNMGAGHGGKSGRFDSLKETAEEFAFILWQMGMAD